MHAVSINLFVYFCNKICYPFSVIVKILKFIITTVTIRIRTIRIRTIRIRIIRIRIIRIRTIRIRTIRIRTIRIRTIRIRTIRISKLIFITHFTSFYYLVVSIESNKMSLYYIYVAIFFLKRCKSSVIIILR